MANAYVERGPERNGSASVPRQHHIACSREDLVQVVIEAFRCGSAQAREDGSHVVRDGDMIFRAASAACDKALRTYVPLDERKFCEVFTLAWAAGYCAPYAGSAGAERGMTTEGKRLHG